MVLGIFFFFNIRIESKGNRICFYICNSLEKVLNPLGYSGAKVLLGVELWRNGESI